MIEGSLQVSLAQKERQKENKDFSKKTIEDEINEDLNS